MKPHDILRVSYNNGVSHFWEVSAVLLGGTGQESVIELTPINQTPSGYGKTLCPAALLHILVEGGGATVYAA